MPRDLPNIKNDEISGLANKDWLISVPAQRI